MGSHVMIVFTESVEGMDDEFDDWYSGTHVPDVLAIDGFTAVRRFRRVEGYGPAELRRYLAIWEIEGDLEKARRALAAGPPRAKSPAYDSSRTIVEFYSAVTDRLT